MMMMITKTPGHGGGQAETHPQTHRRFLVQHRAIAPGLFSYDQVNRLNYLLMANLNFHLLSLPSGFGMDAETPTIRSGRH